MVICPDAPNLSEVGRGVSPHGGRIPRRGAGDVGEVALVHLNFTTEMPGELGQGFAGHDSEDVEATEMWVRGEGKQNRWRLKRRLLE